MGHAKFRKFRKVGGIRANTVYSFYVISSVSVDFSFMIFYVNLFEKVWHIGQNKQCLYEINWCFNAGAII